MYCEYEYNSIALVYLWYGPRRKKSDLKTGLAMMMMMIMVISAQEGRRVVFLKAKMGCKVFCRFRFL